MKTIGNVQKDGQVRAVASGALTDGTAVVINADGTVSVVSGASSSLGSAVVFESANSNNIGGTVDSSNNRVVYV